MKHRKPIFLWLVFWSLLAACAPPADPVSVTRPVTAVTTPTTPTTPTTSPTVTLTPWITVTPNTTATVPGLPPTPETAVPTPSQLGQPIAAAAQITVGDWSPDGRYFTYWTHTAEDADIFMPGDFYIYDTEQEQSCPFTGYRTGTTSWKRRHLWLPNGEILIFGDEDVVAFQPCGDDFAILTDRFPEPITRVVTAAPNRSHFLLTSENGYWLYGPEGHQVQPVAEFNQGMDGGAAFSPDGRFVALNGDEGGSYLLDVATGTVSLIAIWHGGATSREATPQWINEDQFVIISSNDLGPVLIDVDGTRQNVGLAFFNRATPLDSAIYAQRDDQSGHFHLLLEIFDDEEYPLRLYHSESGEREALTAGQAHFMNAVLAENGRWLLTLNSTEDNGREWWIRPIDPPNSTPQRLVTNDDTINLWMAPVGDYVAVGYSDKLELLTLPDATVLATYAVAEQTIYPLGFSPDGRFLVLEAVSPEGRETLFILPVKSS